MAALLLEYLVHSEAAPHHANEDVARADVHPRNDSVLLCALADGQGGRFGGASAARVAVATCFSLASQSKPETLTNRKGVAYQKITSGADAATEADGDAGFCTLVALSATSERIIGASVGDSAALLIHPNDFVELTQNQRRNPPVGSSAAIPTGFEACWSSPDDVLLVMSDGVWRYVGFEAIVDAARCLRGKSLIQELRNL